MSLGRVLAIGYRCVGGPTAIRHGWEKTDTEAFLSEPGSRSGIRIVSGVHHSPSTARPKTGGPRRYSFHFLIIVGLVPPGVFPAGSTRKGAHVPSAGMDRKLYSRGLLVFCWPSPWFPHPHGSFFIRGETATPNRQNSDFKGLTGRQLYLPVFTTLPEKYRKNETLLASILAFPFGGRFPLKCSGWASQFHASPCFEGLLRILHGPHGTFRVFRSRHQGLGAFLQENRIRILPGPFPEV